MTTVRKRLQNDNGVRQPQSDTPIVIPSVAKNLSPGCPFSSPPRRQIRFQAKPASQTLNPNFDIIELVFLRLAALPSNPWTDERKQTGKSIPAGLLKGAARMRRGEKNEKVVPKSGLPWIVKKSGA